MNRHTIAKLAIAAGISILIISLLFAGCAPAQAPAPTTPAAPKPTPVSTPAPAPAVEVPPPPGVTKIDLEVLGAGQGGAGWALAHAYAAIINKYGPKWLRATGVATRGTVDNLVTVYKNAKARPYTIMYLSEPMVDAAMLGLKDWGFTEKITTRPLMLAHAITSVNPVATLNPNIKKWSDLAGKKIVTDKPGSAKRASFLDMVNVADFKIEQVNINLEEANDLLISGQADAVVAPLLFGGPEKGTGGSAMIELLSQKPGKVAFITIPKEIVEKASKATNIAYIYLEMPPKYIDPTVDYNVGSLSDNLAWGAFPEFPESVAYLVTKLAYEHADEFAAYHAVGKASTSVAIPWISSPQNTHKGALKFYQEKGIKIGLPEKPIEALRAGK